MAENFDFAGARWWKFDFHTHTPASEDYGKGPNQETFRQRTPGEWLLDFMRAEIDCVAVTDHNTGVWIDKLQQEYRSMEQEKPEGFRELYLFPGVEITVHGGIHLLALFSPERTKADIDGLLGAVFPERVPEPVIQMEARKSLVDVAKIIDDKGGLAIPAHADGEKGIFAEEDQTLKTILQCEHIIAAEVLDKTSTKHGSVKEHWRGWSCVLGSDSHHPADNAVQGEKYPGSHFTWIKMGKPSIEGLRLALIDGEPFSVLRGDEHTENPNKYAPFVLEGITIQNARYAGRGQPMRAQFSPWMTALIGGRGTGKSTVVEMLRIALRRDEDLPKSLRDEFSRFATVPESRDEEGALTEATEITADALKDGIRFRIRWRWDGQEHAIEEQKAGDAWVPAPGEVRLRFPVRIFSQKQVLAFASDPDALLSLIDDDPQVNREDWAARHNVLEERYLNLQGRIRGLDAQIGEHDRIEGELADAKRQRTVFEESDHEDVLIRYQNMKRQRRSLDDRFCELEGAEDHIRRLSDQLEPTDIPTELFDQDNPVEAQAWGFLEKAVEKEKAFVARLQDMATEMTNFRKEWQRQLSKSAWAKQETETNKDYEQMVSRLQEEGVSDPQVYGMLVQSCQNLESRLRELDALEAQKKRLLEEVRVVLGDIEESRVQLSRRRVTFLNRILTGNSLVQITPIPFGHEPYNAEAEFRRRINRNDKHLAGDVLSDDATEGILADLYKDVPCVDGRSEKILGRIHEIKQQITSIWQGESIHGKTKWFHNHIKELRPDQMDYFRLWWPEDSLKIEYRPADSNDFRPISQGSPGQKSSAILAFLLSYGDEPIILDQPEDDLDNHLIYDLIVQQIRENKRRRQVIVVTHNPNIVVNGDAEQVIAMDHHKGQCVVVSKGTGCLQKQNVREEICRIMEGGRQAFKNRYKRLLDESGRA